MTSKNASGRCLEGTLSSLCDDPPLKLVSSYQVQLLIKVDIGTGSGKWVLEVAEEWPSARVVGLDLSPIQPTLVPSNAEFIVEDVNQGIGFNDASTDLVHSRYPSLFAALTQINSRWHNRISVAQLFARNFPHIDSGRWLGATCRAWVPLCHFQ